MSFWRREIEVGNWIVDVTAHEDGDVELELQHNDEVLSSVVCLNRDQTEALIVALRQALEAAERSPLCPPFGHADPDNTGLCIKCGVEL